MPEGVELHNPFEDLARRIAITRFCEIYYGDDRPRAHLVGINPSRLTKTSTGVNYTDGYSLETFCNIQNDFSKKREVTARFFYQVVEAYGGCTKFYGDVFAWAAMPIGVTRHGKYKNYYDSELLPSLEEVVIKNLEWMRNVPSNGTLIVIGIGQNKDFIENLDWINKFYRKVVYLPHPRWIVQYKSRDIDKYISMYMDALS